MRPVSRIHASRHPGLALVATALLPLVFGCGRVPTSPAAGVAPASLRTTSGGTSYAETYDASLVIWSPTSAATCEDVEKENGLESVGSAGNSEICRVPAGSDPLIVAQQLEQDSRVAWAEPNYLAETAESRGHSWAFDDGTNDQTGYEDQTAAARLGLAQAHVVSNGKGVVVAILDTGVNPNHPLLQGKVLPGYDFVSDDADASEFPDGIDHDGDGLVNEALGHGTHVAGIVALAAPGAFLLPVRVLDQDGRGDAVAIARGIDYAVSRGARVVNLSLGMLTESRAIEEALERAHAGGVVIVASAGNWGAEEPEEYPASSDQAAAIAATTAGDWPATFTSFGEFVALSAPGEGIRSAYWNGHTAVWSGTSMSAPFVSGGAALLLALHPSWAPSDVMTRLRQTAHPLDPSIEEATEHFGAGRLDLAAALLPDRGLSGGGTLVDRNPDLP